MKKVLICDFGSQFTMLIARSVRALGYYSEIIAVGQCTAEKLRNDQIAALILSGGPESVYSGKLSIEREIFDLGIPILGICYGMQLLAHIFGGKVGSAGKKEYGHASFRLNKASLLSDGFAEVGEIIPVWMSRGDQVLEVPQGFSVYGCTENTPCAWMEHKEKKIYGIQFHPEVTHTRHGVKILQNFLEKVCQIKKVWNMQSFKEEAIQLIRAQVGEGYVLCALSGGVDSAVTAALLQEAIGDRLICVFVDNGMMRYQEGQRVVDVFRHRLGIHLIHVDAGDLFLQRLAGVEDAEEKRKIVGAAFIEVFEKEAIKFGKPIEFLAQGTLYPDVIESIVTHQGGVSAMIKSHHNVGGLPERMNMKLVEPLRMLFKDEVRKLGQELGLPDSIVFRHPFPGPGFAVRIVGEVTREKCALLREIDRIYIDELHIGGLYSEIWQAGAILLPVKTVGVMGDGRSFEHACVLRAVCSSDGMTADVYPFEIPFLSSVTNKIINEVHGVNRVVYDCTSKPPGTIEWM